MTDVARLQAEVNQLRTELRRIRTTDLRAAVDQNTTDIAAAESDIVDLQQLHSGLVATRSSDQLNIVNQTWTTITFNTAVEDDPGGDLSLNTSTGVVTVATAGWYALAVTAHWAALSTFVPRAILAISLNGDGGTGTLLSRLDVAPTGSNWIASTATIAKLSANDTVEASVWHAKGDNTPDIQGPSSATRFAITRLR